MTILVLAHKRFLEIPSLFPVVFSFDWFLRKNRRGIITIFSAVFLLAGVAVYLGGLYFTFQSGIMAKSDSQQFAKLRSEITILELRVQERQIFTSADAKAILDSMEKISGMKYLTPESVAVIHGLPAQ